MIDFRTRKTRIRVLQSIIYLIVIVAVDLFYKEFLINLFEFGLRKIDSGISRIFFPLHSSEEEILGWILLSPLWIYWLLMPLYRSIKRWVFRGK